MVLNGQNRAKSTPGQTTTMAAESKSHRPRTKNGSFRGTTPESTDGTVAVEGIKGTPQPAFPLAASLWPARVGVSSWVVLALILIGAGLFRWAVGFWGYSGFNTPPMYGDFEAQRHWMELTTHVPMSEWYFHDLEWWGLDYPPLTAYHSWLLGKIGMLFDPSWFALYKSRGVEDAHLKIFMRATVIVSEYLTFVPALVVLTRRLMRIRRVDAWESSLALVAILMQPSIILIDHGHFQYNTVMLGLMLAALSSFCMERWLWCCVFFVGALGFKQMALYYAPAMFAALLGVCITPRINVARFIKIAVATLASFLVLFGPFLVAGWWNGPVQDADGKILDPSMPVVASIPWIARYFSDQSTWYYPLVQQLSQAIHRIFPFARGIFEDKVANFWCVANVVVKLRAYPASWLQQAALAATVVAIIPPCLIIFLRPRTEALLYGIAATAWGFFLCSFQVHEKSVLLPLLPMTLVLAQRHAFLPSIRAWVGLANLLGVWTMYPLLKRDQLRVPYAVITLLWAYLLGLPPTSFSLFSTRSSHGHGQLSVATKALHLSFYALMGIWHVVEAVVAVPPTKPDLWVVLNAGVGAAGFGVCYLWCLYQALMKSGLMDSLNWQREPQKTAGSQSSTVAGRRQRKEE
ncbi:MAG: hypothetical protein M1823_004516 [Watsoniomyces obsoletus]|nr:MAG: hypothetical protein M1823_004516 [Watsoniomyces obsoletus]